MCFVVLSWHGVLEQEGQEQQDSKALEEERELGRKEREELHETVDAERRRASEMEKRLMEEMEAAKRGREKMEEGLRNAQEEGRRMVEEGREMQEEVKEWRREVEEEKKREEEGGRKQEEERRAREEEGEAMERELKKREQELEAVEGEKQRVRVGLMEIRKEVLEVLAEAEARETTEQAKREQAQIDFERVHGSILLSCSSMQVDNAGWSGPDKDNAVRRETQVGRGRGGRERRDPEADAWIRNSGTKQSRTPGSICDLRAAFHRMRSMLTSRSLKC